MSTRGSDQLPRLLQGFFREHLMRVRGASPHTVRAYKDAVRLLFCFIAERETREVADIRLEHLNVEGVTAFLDHLESARRNGVTTRNARLAAIRSLFRYLARTDPTRAAEYQRVLSLPSKKAPRPVVSYLEPEEIRILLRQPDRRTSGGVRDHALILFLYNTGARVSEALQVRSGDLQLRPPRSVRLRGKGKKDRICPLWADTARVLRPLLDDVPNDGEGPVFRNARGGHLSRDGVAYLLQKHIDRATVELPLLRHKTITPHALRHSCAVALLQSGMDMSVIRDYLGHESIATTSRYVATNLKMKKRALEAFWNRAGISTSRARPWKPRASILDFLESL